MSEYSAMTDAAINRRVAERQGWHDFEMSSYWLDDYDGATEVECEFGTSPRGDYRPLPDVASDLNATAALDFGEWTIEITRYPDGSVGVDVIKPGRRLNAGHESNIARAVSEAWLMYMDAMEAGT